MTTKLPGKPGKIKRAGPKGRTQKRFQRNSGDNRSSIRMAGAEGDSDEV